MPVCSSRERDPPGRIWFLGFLLILFWFLWSELEKVEQATARRNNPSGVGLGSWRSLATDGHPLAGLGGEGRARAAVAFSDAVL
jgi:hypothetical protein